MRFGWVTFLLTALCTVLLAVTSLDSGPVLAGLFVFSELIAFWRCVVRPLRDPLTLKRVALFMDEMHPELEDRMSTAVDLGSHGNELASPWIIEQFLEETTPIVRESSFSDLMDPDAVFNRGVAAISILLAAGLITVTFSHLWLPSIRFALPERFAQKIMALPFTVEPGDVRVRRGDNQMIWVRSDRVNEKAFLRWRVAREPWQVVEAVRSTSDDVRYFQFRDIQQDIEYRVEMGRISSEPFRITTWTPPEVTSMDLEYDYPAYLNRPTRVESDGGNIVAIEGTQVGLHAMVNKQLARVDLVLDSGARIPMEQSGEATWSTRFMLERDDAYHLELVDLGDAPSEYDPKYTIVATRDKPPEIRIFFPRGDSEVSSLDEIPFDFQVTDDFGFDAFGIQYEVAGREPIRITLSKTDETLLETTGHHEIFLEELNLDVGDFITWTVWAEDANPARNEYEFTGDPYFLEVRPFKRRYREAVSDGGGQGGGGAAESPVRMQKEVMIASWKLRKNSRRMKELAFLEQREVIRDTQAEVLEMVSQAQGLNQSGPEMIQLRLAINNSIDALDRAALPDPKPELSKAATHQQQAYRLLLRLTPDEAQVTRNNGQGGGGGGPDDTRPDISALEMDRNRNYYEDENATRVEQEVAEEILRKIKELAQRQRAFNTELDELISELQNAKTEEERERVRRKLEQLEEELKKNLDRLDSLRQDLASEDLSNERTREASQSLDAARRQMTRSLEQLQRDEMQQARASGSRAADSLEDIEEQLQQFSRDVAARRMRRLQERMEGLQEKQRDIAQRVESLREENLTPSFDGQEAAEREQEQVQEDKERLAESFVEMMDEASELAERARQTQELMSRELGDWLRETSREGILEDIEESQRFVRYGVWDAAASEERKIARKLDEAAEGLRNVSEQLIEDDVEGMQKALDRIDDLLKGARERQRVAESETRQDTASDEESAEGQSASNDRAAMREFVREGSLDWIDGLRNAESLLQDGSAARRRIARVREGIEDFRRQWRDRALAPQYDLFLETALHPLEEVAQQLQSEIERRMSARELMVADDGAVPEKYRKRVAEYFKELSESEGAR